jgi:Flp pilus assembly protein TadG
VTRPSPVSKRPPIRSDTMSAVRRPRRRSQRSSNAQSLVEFALLSPVVVLLILGGIDVSRAVYAYNAISNASREGARLASLKPQVNSDCDPLARMKTVAQGFSLTQDPHSIYDVSPTSVNTDPNNSPSGRGPTTPTAGKGYMYIYPAVATNSTGTCSNTNNRPTATSVSVQVDYAFTPITPLVSSVFGSFVMRSTSVVGAAYQ